MGSIETPSEIDVLIIGAGMSSFALWKALHDLPFPLTVKIYEKAPAPGGVWYWNCYPGARVDGATPIYQYFSKDIYSNFHFSEKYAGFEELRKYFRYVEKTWNMSQDIEYNKCVEGAHWDEERHMWKVKCQDGSEIVCRWLLPCLGFAGRRYLPPFPGLENFRGKTYHTSVWPQEGVDFKGKKVAIIGTGASGVQVIQEIGEQVEHLTVYQRTPNLCLPMRQEPLDPKEQENSKQAGEYDKVFDQCRYTANGYPWEAIKRKTFDDTPEEREKFYQSLWDDGGFHFWIGTYQDMLSNQAANDEAYRFWRSQVLKRIKNPEKAKLLAPEKQPHPFGTKRPSLEQRYYEVIDQDQINIIDLNTSPIQSIGPSGIVTKDEGLVEVDILILATGFDVGASISQLNLVGVNGHTITEHWGSEIKTAFGTAVSGFPNLFYLHGPQGLTAFTNAPTASQHHAAWIADTIMNVTKAGWTWFEATPESEENWGKLLDENWKGSLFPKAKSWYQGSNIPWRKEGVMFWSGAFPEYMRYLSESNENDFQGWRKAKVGDVGEKN